MMMPAAALSMLIAAMPPPTVAISYFDNNTAKAELAPLAKGLADMLITDLSRFEAIQVVEREKLNQALAELELSRSRFIDPRTAQKLGRGLAVQYVLTGGYTVVGEKIRIDARVFSVETATVVASEKVEGSTQDFFELEKDLVELLARGLKVATLGPAERSRLRGSGTRSFDAWSRYSAGLDAADRGDVQRAREMFEMALRADPAYRAASSARERLAAVFAREDRETMAAADEALKKLTPGTPDFAAKVDQLLGSLDETKSDQLRRKIAALSWLGERRVLACSRGDQRAVRGNLTVLYSCVPAGGSVSDCPQAAAVLWTACRLRQDPSQWEVIPKVCEYFIHQLPGDKAILGYCERVLLDAVEKGKERGVKAAREAAEEDLKDNMKSAVGTWMRALADNDAAMKAMLAIYAASSGREADTRPR